MHPITGVGRNTFSVCCLLLLALPLTAARRPQYGGSLRIQTAAVFDNLDPSESPAFGNDAAAKENILGNVFETLVELDANGKPQPLLAASWTHDATRKKWLFSVRPNVTLHNGAVWDPPGGVIAIDDRKPVDEILRGLAKPQNAIAVRMPDGTLEGTGPFRVSHWEAGKEITLEAFDRYWGGRPFLDQIDIRLGRPLRDQGLDFDLGKADIVETPLTEVKRIQQRGGTVALSPPVETLALVFDNPKPELDRVRAALACSIDRQAIHSVLLQKQGDISGALLPQWLSGYAFLFDLDRNVAQAKELASNAPPLTLFYDRQNPLLRSIAERIMLNAADAGITIKAAGGTSGDLRLASLRIRGFDPRIALENLAGTQQAPPEPANLYAMEKALIDVRRLVPLFQLPIAYELNPQVRNWSPRQSRWADVWMDERPKP
jgi:ABC-type transport system substrate-binding protein